MTRLVAPAGLARPGPPLSPVLGQAQIKVADFVTRFNLATQSYTPGTPVGARVTREGTGFHLLVVPPTWGLLFRGVTRAGGVTRRDLWGCLRFRGVTTPAAAATALGTLKSLGLQVR